MNQLETRASLNRGDHAESGEHGEGMDGEMEGSATSVFEEACFELSVLRESHKPGDVTEVESTEGKGIGEM